MARSMRSNTGCWTCRVRRKKCDETGLPCSICSSLGLHCHGYGRRPEWFDGGQQEKAKAAAFKAIVRQTSTMKRRDRFHETSLVNMEPCASETLREIQMICAPSIGAEEFISDFTGTTTDSTMNDVAGDLEKAFHVFEFAEGFEHAAFEFDEIDLSLIRAESHDSITELSAESTTNYLPTPTATPVTPLSDQLRWNLLPNSCVLHQTQTKAGGTHFAGNLSSLLTSASTDSELSHGSRPGTLTLAIPDKRSTSTLYIQQEQAALQYYSEVVFPSLVPFLPYEITRDACQETVETSQQLRPYLSYIFWRSTERRVADLRRVGLEPSDSSAIGTPDQQRQPRMPLDDSDGVDKDCLLHLLLAQVNDRGKDWPKFIKKLCRTTPDSNLRRPTFNFAGEILSYMEVLASTLTSAEPEFAPRYLAAHKIQGNVGYVTGVEFWLLDCLIRVVQLRRWKKEQISKGSLNMIELVTRSLAIEHDLKRHRKAKQQHTDSKGHARSAFMQVYASAVAVFLQCTVSDPRPQVAEIQKEVSNTIQALQCLHRASLLKRLAWPLCIAACMTTQKNQQVFFRSLSQRVTEVWGPDENICAALEVAIECWRLQESAIYGETYDWSDAMKSRGCWLLLF